MKGYLKTLLAHRLNRLALDLMSREVLEDGEYQYWLDNNPPITPEGYLERYRMIRRLSGERSANDVMLADHWLEYGRGSRAGQRVQGSEQQVVLKFCIPYAPKGPMRHHQLAQVLAAFQDEVRVNNLIGGTNIEGVVRSMGGGRAGRLHFLRMQYVEGHSLDREEIPGPGQKEFAKRLARLAYLANTLSQLHHYNICHLDLKPQNVMLCKDESSKLYDKLLLCDFGYSNSRLRDKVSPYGGALSPVYAAPEQARLSQSNVGPAADYFSFGVVAHEYLTGHGIFPKALEIYIEDGYDLSPRYLKHLENPVNKISKAAYPEIWDILERLVTVDSGARLQVCPNLFDIAYVFQNVAKRLSSAPDVNIEFLDNQLHFYKEQSLKYDERAEAKVALDYVESVRKEMPEGILE
jgi:serine/threonine protein kinase